jgi:hypothetical protein
MKVETKKRKDIIKNRIKTDKTIEILSNTKDKTKSKDILLAKNKFYQLKSTNQKLK